MATLTIINNATLSTQGNSIIGKQGNATDTISTGYSLTGILGQNHQRTGLLATATAALLYNAATDLPATGKYLHFWADQNCMIQLIGATANVIHPVTALVPFVLSGGAGAVLALLATANTTAISGAAAPTLETLAKVYIANYSGLSMNYTLLIVN